MIVYILQRRRSRTCARENVILTVVVVCASPQYVTAFLYKSLPAAGFFFFLNKNYYYYCYYLMLIVQFMLNTKHYSRYFNVQVSKNPGDSSINQLRLTLCHIGMETSTLVNTGKGRIFSPHCRRMYSKLKKCVVLEFLIRGCRSV